MIPNIIWLMMNKKMMNDLTKIEILWEGPFSSEEIKNLCNSEDYGLYQIYGTHNIFGSDSLLYIGLANNQTFATRLSQHEYWLEWENSEMKIYIGKLGGIKQISEDEWSELIIKAEKLLIYFAKPTHNSSNLNNYGANINNTIVINYGRKNRLPMEVSTFYYDSQFWSDDWKPYHIEYLI